MLQNATPLTKSAPWPPNISDEHVSCTAPATQNVPRLPSFFWKCYKTLTFCSLLAECTIPCACYAKRHLNVQKCSEPVSFLHFWLRNVLRATTACNGSSLIWPHVPPAALVSLLFDPLEPQIIGKKQSNRDFSTFSCACIFFLLTLSLLWSSLFFSSLLFSSLIWLFPPLLFHLSILSEVWLLNFLRLWYVMMCPCFQSFLANSGPKKTCVMSNA